MKYESASFRDPNGYIFYHDNEVFRFIGESAIPDFNKFIDSGLSKSLIDKKQLIPFIKEESNKFNIDRSGIIVKADKIDFISYPYEWCFSQLKDAALLTLIIAKKALKYDLWLKDASAYNIQFHNGKPIFIDILSFESYPEDSPWVAYKQFCQHFLAPLLLMAYTDFNLSSLLKNFIDGIPLELASRLLPFKTKLSLFIFIHIHLHAKIQKKYEDKGESIQNTMKILPRGRLLNLLESLSSVIKSLKLKQQDTEWRNYYNITNYSKKAFRQKKNIIDDYIKSLSLKTVWDFGANIGEFSRTDSLKSMQVISFDIDYMAVEKNYCYNKENKINNVLPLLFDLTNPSPAIGWANVERKSLIQRCDANLILALALVHHIAISNNVPLRKVAELFSSLADYLIIEFVPKEDSQVKKLLSSREDIFPEYNINGFEKAFLSFYDIIKKDEITDTSRILYLLKTKMK